jgi:hypothetical protein
MEVNLSIDIVYKGEKGILFDRGGTFRCIQDFAHAIRIAEVVKDLGQVLF